MKEVSKLITTEKKSQIIADLATDKKDTGSPVVQVGILTARIAEITEHLQTNKKDHMARRGLLQMVGKRKKLLKYIADKDPALYLSTINKLGILK